MIRVRCHTNLDNPPGVYAIEWPGQVACRPVLGDCVQAIDSKYRLRIVRITHCSDRMGTCLLLELNK